MEYGNSDSKNSSGPMVPSLGFPELSLGRVIGRGGFSVVNEIQAIHLQEVFDTSIEETNLRQELAASCCDEETGFSKYVVKTLRPDLPEEEHTKGVVDLAVEARFLATLSHPHIIAMKATSNSDPLESKYFVVLDRLVSTLEEKLVSWRKEVGLSMGFWCGPCIGYCCSKKQVLNSLWMERLIVARDVSSALLYLHNQDIVYRDLKPDNVGLNDDGEVKIFDFGLAKRLHPDDKTADDLYLLTGNTGSLRYMAPEVATGHPYDKRVDAYSFGILFWQICALATPYAGYSMKMHADLVVGKGYRPKPDPSWPTAWAGLMKDCWSSDIFNRPDFAYILQVLDSEIEELLRDDGVVPSRSSEIRAKKRKSQRKTAEKVGQRLDVDTRISSLVNNGNDAPPELRHDADIV